jgi:hypothetical protein
MTVLWYVVAEERLTLDGFITESTNCCGYSLSIRSYLLKSFQSWHMTLARFAFHVMRVVGFELQITTSMSRFPAHFRGHFRTPLHDQDVQEWESIITIYVYQKWRLKLFPFVGRGGNG